MKSFVRTISLFLSLSVAVNLLGQPILAQDTCTQPPKGLVNWWPGDGDAKDRIGHVDGQGGAFANAEVGQGFSFAGATIVTFGAGVGNFGTNDFTLDFWIQTPSGQLQAVIEKRVGCGPESFWGIRSGVRSPGTLFFELLQDATRTNEIQINSTRTVNDGKFHNVALVRQGTNVQIYIDGTLDIQGTTPQPVNLVNGASLTAGTSVCVGQGPTQFFNGELDEIAIFNRALADKEIAEISQAGTAGMCKDCQVRIDPKWGQVDQPWGDTVYDSCRSGPVPCLPRGNDFMKQQGCATTALAMALHQAGVATDPVSTIPIFDPGLLNEFMELGSNTANGNLGDYVGHTVNFEMTTFDVSRATSLARGGKLLYFDDSFRKNPFPSDLKDLVCKGHPVIVAVAPFSNTCTPNVGSQPGGHYVLVTGEHDDNLGKPHFDIVDPGCIRGNANASPPILAITSLDTYNNNFIIRGFVSDPADVSTLEIATDNSADVLVTDSVGNRTGFDANSQDVQEEIPRSSYGHDFIADNDTGQQSSGIEHSINLFQPSQGIYHITVTGIELGTYELFIGAFSTNGTPQPRYSKTGIVGPGSMQSLTVQYTNSNSGATNVTTMATAGSTLDDINNALKLGLIDSPGIANSLSQKLQNSANASRTTRINILNAFINEVNAQSGKHINGVAIQVLLEDANSLIQQITQNNRSW